MAIDFPNSPVDNDTYTFGDKTWIYADGKWTIAFTSTMTLASLNVTGDITVDTTTLKVDSSTDRVGIGTASPTETLDVRGNIYTTGSVIFEGTDNLHETTLTVTDPTADRTITLPNNTGTVALLGDTTYVGTTAITLNRSSANLGLTGITSISMPGSTSGTLVIQPTAITGSVTVTFPATTGTVITTGDTGTVTNTMLAGSIANSKTTATSANTFSAIVARDGSGNFTAGTITAALTGNASTATNLSTDRANWSTNGTISATVGQLAWKNYGNSHTIFDASQSTSPSGGAVNNTNAAIAWTSTYPTLMGWNGTYTYGVRVDSARTSDNTTGNAATATSATSATTATNQSGGTVSATSITSSGTIYSTREVTTDYTTTNIRAGSGGSAVSIALHASGIAPQFRVGASVDNVYLRNYNDSAYSNFYAIIVNTSSRSLKQDISNWPVKPQSAGSAVNGLELINSLDIVKQLRPVTYKWIHDDYMAQLPITETRVKALERLNSARQNAGIDPWFGEDLIHKCGRDCQGSIESPCPRYLDWDKGQIGFIAEEVAEVVPQAGRIDAEGNFSGLDGLSMSAIAIAAIKELEVRVAALENR